MKRVKPILFLLSVGMLLSCLTACTTMTQSNTALNSPQSVTNDSTANDPVENETVKDIQPETQNSGVSTKEKTTLTIACVGCSESKIKMVINEFNKTYSDYQVVLSDYGYNTTVDQGKMKLQTALQSSNPPDMLLFDSEVFETSDVPSQGLSPLTYISRGMLLDLDEFVNNDPELNADDFVIWNALHEFGGMYVVGPKFRVHALYCLPETAEQYQGWTTDDYLALQATLEPDQDLIYNITPERFIRYIASSYIHEVVDIETAICDFDNPDFIALLDAACQVTGFHTEDKHTQEDGSFKSAPEMIMDGELVFCTVILTSAVDVSFDRWRASGKSDTPGDAMGYIGYPTPDGSSGVYVELPYAVGICARTEQAEGCWEFLRFMLENPMYQSAYDGTPVLESKLTENLQSINEYTKDSPWETEKSDQEILVTLAEICDKMSYYDEDILGVIEEEASEMLSGKISTEEAAARIQKRASIIVMERYG